MRCLLPSCWPTIMNAAGSTTVWPGDGAVLERHQMRSCTSPENCSGEYLMPCLARWAIKGWVLSTDLNEYAVRYVHCLVVHSHTSRSSLSWPCRVSVLWLVLCLLTTWSPTTWPWWRNSRQWTLRETSPHSLQTLPSTLPSTLLFFFIQYLCNVGLLCMIFHVALSSRYNMYGTQISQVCYFVLSVTVPEKLDCFITRYAEHNHEKWCTEKVRPCVLTNLLKFDS